MEWSKLKNIIILILLLVNLFFLAMTGIQQRDSVQYQEQALADAVTVLERNGIRLAAENIPEQMKIRSMTVQRDRGMEQGLAAALLGECTVSDLGGGRYSYTSAVGNAEFRSNGNFSIVFSAALPIAEEVGSESAHALDIAAKIGLSGVVASKKELDDGGASVVLYQTWQEIPVYSCQITLQYKDESLVSISGQRLMGEPQLENSSETLISVPTALMRLLNGINDMGDICSEVIEMTPGYQMTNPTEGTRMNPVWYVVTDTGAYQLNAITGVLERA